ncbi:hypothetical protein RND81_01G090800 [Saponaria officinalis]|uniref:Uncharacterized protein n=1 Tax=Saponaria officinalis TaxID=3572 RepID=A0AAW1NHI5_SAPOF
MLDFMGRHVFRRCTAELSECLDIMYPFQTTKTSSLLTSMLSVSCHSNAWAPYGNFAHFMPISELQIADYVEVRLALGTSDNSRRRPHPTWSTTKHARLLRTTLDLSINVGESLDGARQIHVKLFFLVLYFYSFRVVLVVFNLEYLSKSCKIVLCKNIF